jgi:hypothetical protein
MSLQAIPLRIQHPLMVPVLLIPRITLSGPPIRRGIHLLVLALVLPGVLPASVLAC